MELIYDHSVYRPPSEATSIIFQVTLGCSFNRCSFCNKYRSKEYLEIPSEEIKTEIGVVSRENSERMIQILEHLHYRFPNLERVSCYSMPRNILQKKDEELAELRKVGLKILYGGIES